jgi:hypothetical protein
MEVQKPRRGHASRHQAESPTRKAALPKIGQSLSPWGPMPIMRR